MKNVVKLKLIISLLFITQSGNAQTFLGQSKEYIINKYKECYISANDTNWLVFKCGDANKFWHEEFLFDHQTHLCNLTGYEMPEELRERFLTDIVKDGYKFYGNSSTPIPTLTSKTSSGKFYSNGTLLITVMDTDLQGNFSSLLFGILTEKYH